MFENYLIYIIAFLCFIVTITFLFFIYELLNSKKHHIRERLKGISFSQVRDEEDILTKPFMERTLGVLSKQLVYNMSEATPEKFKRKIDIKLERAGRPKNLKASDLLVLMGIIGITVSIVAFFILIKLSLPILSVIALTVSLTLFGIYIPWFAIARMETIRIKKIRRNLPDVMDLLVVSVEAGLAFDMALLKIVEKYKGPVASEFQKVLKDIQLGKTRKEAFKIMSDRLKIEELSALLNAIIQSEQLGVGLGRVLRIQADLIREKRQQWVEELAMKAPIKMLFPLVLCMFPAIFIVVLGPAVINLLNALRSM